MLQLDTIFPNERSDLPAAYNLVIRDGDDNKTRVVLEGESQGVERPRLFNQNGTLYDLPEPIDPDPEPNPDDEFSETSLELEQERVFEYIKNLYYTRKGSDKWVDILYEELVQAYDNSNVLYTMELIEGDVALAKALLSTYQHSSLQCRC